MFPNKKIRGRGSNDNPVNRFEGFYIDEDPEENESPEKGPRTKFFNDTSQTIIAYNNSPDVGFNAGINPYRGCEHGCIYCYARPTHEYLGFSAGLDFETKIMVKKDAPELLRKELSSPKWKPQVLALSGVTDPFQPAERKLEITRRCLQVLAEFRNPVVILTKNHLVTRDIDYLKELAKYEAVMVGVTLTSLDEKLISLMEPRTSRPQRRLDAMRRLSEAGIPVNVNVAPVIPGLTDHEVPDILKEAAKAGAQTSFFVPVRLPLGVAPLFELWLERHFPARKEKILNRIRSMKDGKLNDSRFGNRMRGKGAFAEELRSMFYINCRKYALNEREINLSTRAFRRMPADGQMDIFQT